MCRAGGNRPFARNNLAGSCVGQQSSRRNSTHLRPYSAGHEDDDQRHRAEADDGKHAWNEPPSPPSLGIASETASGLDPLPAGVMLREVAHNCHIVRHGVFALEHRSPPVRGPRNPDALPERPGRASVRVKPQLSSYLRPCRAALSWTEESSRYRNDRPHPTRP